MHAVLGGAALSAVWIAVLLFARQILRTVGKERLSLTAALGTAMMAAIPPVIGRATDDLLVATVITGGVALAAWAVLRRRAPVPPAPSLSIPLAPRWALGVGMVQLALVIAVTLLTNLWDEDSGHFALGSVISRGVFPPEHPLFPGEPFRYHYGFDVLSGEVRRFTGLPIVSAIDAATIWCFALLLLVAHDVGGALGGRLGAGLALILAPLGAGFLQAALLRDFGALEIHTALLPEAWARSMPPPTISNFFQHPMGFGMSLGLAVLLLLGSGEIGAFVVGTSLLGLLSICHIVFFGVIGLTSGAATAIGAVLAWRAGSPLGVELRGLALRALGLISALVIARGLGGFLLPGGVASPIELGVSYFQEPWDTKLLHLFTLFGLPLLLLPVSVGRLFAGGARGSSLRLTLVLAAVFGFAVPSFARYRLSWDIVKFYAVGLFFANVLLADLLAAWWARRAGWLKAVALGTAVVLATSTSWFWLVRSSVFNGRFGVDPWQFKPPPEVIDALAERLEPHAGPRDRVLSTNVDVSQGAGFLTPGFDWRHHGVGFMMDRARFDTLLMHRQAARHDLRAPDLQALGIRFVVFSPGDEIALSPEGRAALASPDRFERLFTVEAGGQQRTVYRVLDPS